MRKIMAIPKFKRALYYSVFRDTSDYDMATIVGIAKAIHSRKIQHKFKSIVYVDGVQKNKRHEYGRELRNLGIPIRKVQRVARDESNALIRLADSLAGFVRDILTHKGGRDLEVIFESAKRKAVISEV